MSLRGTRLLRQRQIRASARQELLAWIHGSRQAGARKFHLGAA